MASLAWHDTEAIITSTTKVHSRAAVVTLESSKHLLVGDGLSWSDLIDHFSLRQLHFWIISPKLEECLVDIADAPDAHKSIKHLLLTDQAVIVGIG